MRSGRSTSFRCDLRRIAVSTLVRPIDGHTRGYEIYALCLHQLQGALCQEATMLDGVDTRFNSQLCGEIAVRVCRGVALPFVRFGDDGSQFVGSELRGVNGIGLGEYAA